MTLEPNFPHTRGVLGAWRFWIVWVKKGGCKLQATEYYTIPLYNMCLRVKIHCLYKTKTGARCVSVCIHCKKRRPWIAFGESFSWQYLWCLHKKRVDSSISPRLEHWGRGQRIRSARTPPAHTIQDPAPVLLLFPRFLPIFTSSISHPHLPYNYPSKSIITSSIANFQGVVLKI